jgi:hypothetical protein
MQFIVSVDDHKLASKLMLHDILDVKALRMRLVLFANGEKRMKEKTNDYTKTPSFAKEERSMHAPMLLISNGRGV